MHEHKWKTSTNCRQYIYSYQAASWNRLSLIIWIIVTSIISATCGHMQQMDQPQGRIIILSNEDRSESEKISVAYHDRVYPC